mgnify:FL=1|jgi:hypothetical protein|tara:strand:+ start:426 stop:1406 length:981 start_codon:yes stop_codon:yes gene_type:complete
MSEEAQPQESMQTAETAFANLLSGKEPEPTESEELTEEEPSQTVDHLTVEEEQESSEEVTEEEEEEQQVEAQKYALPFGDNGEVIEVDQGELQNYVLRQQDYTKKTQEVAAEKKQLNEERNSLRAIQSLANQLQDEYDSLKKVEEVENSDEYWDQLKAENPMQFLVERQEMQEKSSERETAQQKVYHMQQQLAQQNKLEQQRTLYAEAQKLEALIPEWKDQQTAEKEKVALLAYGRANSYSDEELNNVSDSRAINMLRKAFLWDELQSKKGNLKQKALATPASSTAVRNANAPRKRMSEFKKAELQLRKTGKLADAASAFEIMLQK